MFIESWYIESQPNCWDEQHWSTEVNERVLTNLGTHWNIRLHWFQLVPISFSSARYPSFFCSKLSVDKNLATNSVIGADPGSLYEYSATAQLLVSVETKNDRRTVDVTRYKTSPSVPQQHYSNHTTTPVSRDKFIESWHRKSTELLRRSRRCQ